MAKADTTSITVRLVGNDAQSTGNLFFMNPRTGTDRLLFSNKSDDMIGVPVCLDCRDPKWRSLDPARPQVMPPGPVITVSTEAPFAFDLAFYTNLGGFVNRAKGEVTASMLEGAPTDSLGRKVVGLLWYPVDPKGRQAGTGASIARGILEIRSGVVTGPQGERVQTAGRRAEIAVTVGYMRR